ncbi:hypothetical protein K502DRAFT_365262 [Neoconidiobolus thromboides FSU 785]|nr:hypothetical protein K502DRAFT_365262 [Neoconidiobolus thromboides FSU 785]
MAPVLKVKYQKSFAIFSSGLDSLELCHFSQLFHQVKDELDCSYRLENASLRLFHIRNKVMSTQQYNHDGIKKFQVISLNATKNLENNKIKIKAPIYKNKIQRLNANDSNGIRPLPLNININEYQDSPTIDSVINPIIKDLVTHQSINPVIPEQPLANTKNTFSEEQISTSFMPTQSNMNMNNSTMNFDFTNNQQLLQQALSAISQNNLNNNLLNSVNNLSTMFTPDYNNQQILMNSLLLQSLNQLPNPSSFNPQPFNSSSCANPNQDINSMFNLDSMSLPLNEIDQNTANKVQNDSNTTNNGESNSALNDITPKKSAIKEKKTISSLMAKKENKKEKRKAQQRSESANKSKIAETETFSGSEGEKDRCCFNCHATSTPLWRRTPDNQRLCNACGLYYKLHQKHRPIDLKKAKDSKKPAYKPRALVCSHCKTKKAALWRRDIDSGEPVCNPCGLFKKMNNRPRPPHLYSNVIKKRVRNPSPFHMSKGSSMNPKSRKSTEDLDSSNDSEGELKQESPILEQTINTKEKAFQKQSARHNTPSTPITRDLDKTQFTNPLLQSDVSQTNLPIINQNNVIGMNNGGNVLDMIGENYYPGMDPGLLNLPFNQVFVPILNNNNYYPPMESSSNTFNSTNPSNSEPDNMNLFPNYFMFQ